ncbi:MAG: cytochrome c biogenesis protein ResB [Bdellovibrionaceae bacterium]|nr:cytochrome c biogenesis protein ResB [Pseudobdellovibrionaceae bacterium]
MFFKKLSIIYKLFVSIKLAIFILISLAVLTAIGTFVESKYDQEFANKLVYHSFWMASVMLLLSINLTMVLIDRWPWKKKHAPFVLAHFGILTLILGSIFTKYLGVDASLSFKEAESSSTISLSDMEIKVYSSFDGEKFSLIYQNPVDMFFIKPTEKKAYSISTAGEEFKVVEYLPFALGRQTFKSVLKGGQPALRFHLFGSRANLVEWLSLELGQTTVSKKFGLATISLTVDKNYKAKNKNELVLFVQKEQIFYSLNNNQKRSLKSGRTFQTGWMDFEFRLLEFFPKAQKEFIFKAVEKPSEDTVKAIRIRHEDQSVWVGQNSYARFFKKDKMYVLTYLNKKEALGFSLKLIDFKITKYQGSNKAKSYESTVELENGSKVLISMNEPLKYKGWTFYQSSFIEPEKETDSYVSILSVNRDPGRFLKYVGSALVVIGIIFLFYRRKLS